MIRSIYNGQENKIKYECSWNEKAIVNVTREDRIKNEYVKNNLGVIFINR